jgi:hypothetical protein
VGLLGPELMLLTSPAAAAATTEIQHNRRELLQQQRSMSREGSKSFPSFLRVNSMPVHRLQAGGSFVGRSFRGSSSMRVHSFADRGLGNNRLSMRHSTPATTAVPTAAAAASIIARSSGTSPAACGRDIDNHTGDSKQQHQDLQQQYGQKQTQDSGADENGHSADQGLQETDAGAAAASDAADAQAADSVAGSTTSSTYPEVVSPFLLHQRDRLARQTSLGLRQNSSRSMRHYADHLQLLSLRSSRLVGRQASITPRPDSISGERPAKQPDVELGCKADKDLAVAEWGVAREGGQLPLAAVDRCSRLRHEGCCHSPQLEKTMQEKMEHHLESQVWCGLWNGVCLHAEIHVETR